MSFQGYHIIIYLILGCSNYPLVPVHTSLYPALCNLCSLELLHATDVTILARVKHLHNCIHGTHGSITTSCSFIPVSYQSITAWLGPRSLWCIHSRERSNGPIDKLITEFLLDFAENFKSGHLGTLPRGLYIWLDTPSLPLRVVHMGSDSDPHVVPPLSLSYHFAPKIARQISIPDRVQDPP